MYRRTFLRAASFFGVSGILGIKLPEHAVAATAKTIIPLSKLPVGGNHQFTSKTGEPAMVFRTKTGVFAYSLICTHLGCAVSLDQKILVCPCHGSAFDPLNGGKVLGGPAPRPLGKIKVSISGKNVVEN